MSNGGRTVGPTGGHQLRKWMEGAGFKVEAVELRPCASKHHEGQWEYTVRVSDWPPSCPDCWGTGALGKDDEGVTLKCDTCGGSGRLG